MGKSAIVKILNSIQAWSTIFNANEEEVKIMRNLKIMK